MSRVDNCRKLYACPAIGPSTARPPGLFVNISSDASIDVGKTYGGALRGSPIGPGL
jgi:hypothetical protein